MGYLSNPMVILAIIVTIGIGTIGIIFARLYHRASAERAFVRTGLGGQKVIMSGGAITLPVFHEVILINMNFFFISYRHLPKFKGFSVW